MTDKKPFQLSRRALLAGAAMGTAGLSAALQQSSTDGNLWGGTMALNEAYNVAGNLYVGPDSEKANVTASSGRIYLAADTQTEYYGDGGSWVPMGVGTSSNPVPEVHTSVLDSESVQINNYSRQRTFQLGQDQQGRIYATDSRGQLVAGGPDALNVTDSEDMGELLEYLVNDLSNEPPVIGLGERHHSDARADYLFKTTANLTKIFNFHGNGRGNPMLGPHGSANLTTCIDISPGSTDRSLMEWSYMKCVATSDTDIFGNADHFLTTDGVREINFFSMEFRNFDSNPVLLKNVTIDWNCMVNCWFLANGDGPKITNSNEWRFIGCSFRDTPNAIILDNVTGVTRSGNFVMNGDWTMTNSSSFHPRHEELGALNNLKQRSGLDRLDYLHHGQIDALEFKQHGWNSDFTATTVSGTGNVRFGYGSSRDNLITGSTTGSVAQASVNSHRFTAPSHSFTDTPVAFGAALSGDLDTASRVMLTNGNPSGNDYVGLLFEGDAMKAVASAGGTETTQTLETPVGSTNAVYSVVFNDPTIDVFRGGDDLVGTHTFAAAETPTGSADAILCIRIENGPNAASYEVDTKLPKYVRLPP